MHKKSTNFKPDRNNPAGPQDKLRKEKQPAGVADDTRVVFSEERNRNDG